MSASTVPSSPWRTPTIVLVSCGLIMTLAMGIRHGFGLYLQPITIDMHWGRESFALALAIQNLVWGITQPFAGVIADKYGTGRVVVGGALLYALGLLWMGHPSSELSFILASGLLIGTGLSGVTFSVVAGALGRAFPPEKRSMALGISAAAGSFGQFALLPLTQTLLTHVGWSGALLVMACVALAIAPLAAVLVERRVAHVHTFKQSARQAFG
jgi:MFS family permease